MFFPKDVPPAEWNRQVEQPIVKIEPNEIHEDPIVSIEEDPLGSVKLEVIENEPKSSSNALKRIERIGMETCAMKTESENDSISGHDDPIKPTEDEPKISFKALKHNEEIGIETCAVKTEPEDDSTIVHDGLIEPTKVEPKNNSKAMKHNEVIGMETCTVKTEPEDDSIIVHDDPKEPIEKDPLAISSFQCESCGMKCKTEKGFKEHLDACFKKKLKTCNNKLPDFALETCDLCLTKVTSLKYPEHRYTCELALNIHKRNDFAFETRHKNCCNECGEKFSDTDALVQHVALHKKSGYLCEVCQEPFGRASELKSHFKTYHMKQKSTKVKCEFCEKQISSKYIREHIKVMHPSKYKPMKTKIKYYQAQRKPGQKVVKCAYCITEMVPSSISRHFKNQHPGLKIEYTIVKNKAEI